MSGRCWIIFLLDRVLSSLEGYSVKLESRAHVKELEEDPDESDWLRTHLFTDSQAAVDLLANQDIPRRSRHVEVRIAWVRSHVERGKLILNWIPGKMNPADLLTKCVTTSLFNQHRERLGFWAISDGPLESMFSLMLQSSVATSVYGDETRLAVLEVCCSESSASSQECRKQGIPNAGVASSMQEHRIFSRAQSDVQKWKH